MGAGEVRQPEIRRNGAEGQPAQLAPLRRGPRPESSLDCLQSQQNAAVLAHELIAEPGPYGNQQPG
jgi:hypothetical protein